MRGSARQSVLWLSLFLSLCAPARPGAQVVLSEFQASNIRTLRDEDGNFEDWIEVCNVSAAPVDLGGWYLTDKSDQLNKWQFPSTNLAAGQFLVVFASKKDRRVPGNPLHTNFKLSKDGEYLALVKPDGITIATAYAPSFPPQADDLSYGLPITSQTVTLLGRGAAGKLLVPPNAALGTNWVLPAFDDAGWTDVTTGVGFDLNNSLILVPVADSVADWSAEGVQGSRGWYYGYYNQSADGSPGYQMNDFVLFPRSDAAYGASNYWTGSQYRWPSATVPWDTVGQTDACPNGTNNGAEHWVIRRWRSTTTAIMQARWRMYKTNPTGSGVTGQLYLNGVLKDSAAIGGDDTTGVSRDVMLGEVRQGDVVDLALTPIGAGGETDDGGDGSANLLTVSSLNYMTSLMGSQVGGLMCGSNATVYLRLPFVAADPADLDQLKLRIWYNDGFVAYLNGVPVATRNAPVASPGGLQADSVADWSSTGQQGFNNWYYGYYDQSADADGVYDASADFSSAGTQWTWNGGAWVLRPGDPPWTMISLGGWRPNGTNSGGVHWPIRRWISKTSGQVTCRIAFAKENVACGSGATLRVLQNGVERFSWTLAYNDAAGLQTNLVLMNIQAGDYLDFALDPKGTDGSLDDSCDGCTFSAAIDQPPSEGAVWNSTATASRSPPETSVAEEIDLSGNRDLLVAGTNVLAIHGLNASPSDRDFLVLPELIGTKPGMDPGQHAYFTVPTPGAPNGAGSLTIGPIISDVAHTPLVPGDNDDLVVQARVTPSLRPVKSVTLKYRTMYVAESTTPMYDDGNHGDGAAGDSVYGARIPASASHPGQMVRYCIVAADMNSQETRAPAFPNPSRSPQYFGTVVFDPVLTNSRLPVLHWFIQNPSAANSDVTARCSLFFNGEFYDNIGVNLHGESTRSFPKQSYDLVFNPGYKFRWSDDAPRVGDLNLLTTWADKTEMRNVLAHETYRDGGAPSHFAFPVRVQQNRSFFSVANVVESGNDDFLQRLGLDPQGALYKMYNSAESVAGAEKKTRKNEGTADLQALITGMGQPNATARQAFMFDNLNVPEVIDFLAAKIITADVDCCFKNYYLYRDSDGTGEWQGMPWDVDLSFGRVWTCGTPCYEYFDETIYTNQGITVGYGNTVFTPIYDTPATRQMFLRRLRTLMDELFQPPGTPVTNDFYRLKTLALRDQIAPDAALDLARWGTWGTRETITQAVNRIWNEFLPGRRTFLFRTMSVTNGGEIPAAQPTNAVVQIDGLEYRPSSGNPLQEWLSLTNPNSYAVDISNWRLDGGVRFQFKPGTVIPARSAIFVSPDVNAFRSRQASPKGGEQRLVVGPYDGNLSAWGESLVLTDPTGRLVNSNSYVGSPSLAQRFLRITEIFYNPDPLPGYTNIDAQLFEFLELRNIGPVPLDLRGVRFTEGVQFDFAAGAITNLAAGARVLLVRDTNAFALRYGSGLPVAGQFTGKLDNAGERLRLEDPYGEKILDFSYDNRWYPITDGHGYSLVIVDDTILWSLWGEKTSWRPNGALGGKPGQSDPLPPDFPAIVINEVLAHTDPPQVDAIELYNPAATNVNVGNWYLTDDFNVARKFRIPYPTIIPPQSFIYFTEAQFNSTPGVFPSFALNSEGDDVWLFSADAASTLTGYVQGFDFGATANGVSLGRYTNSAGEIDYPAQVAVTLGRANAGPLVGPIVLSEIMYHPAPTTPSNTPASYIELANVASVSTPLFNPAEPTNTWRLRNAVDFDFPTNVVMSAGSRLLVVGFDPVTNTPALNSFCALYGVPPGTPIYGPWQGSLGNADETIELKKPDPWGTNGVPYVMVEKVHYLDHAPWPESADGAGSSLQRRTLSAYANEPTNWFASTPTAGAPNQPNLLPTVQLTSPIPGTTYQIPTNVLIAATAADSDGTILRVEFRADGQKLGEVLAEPYTFVWTNPAPRSHSLTAVAVDDCLGATESAAVGIAVVSPPPMVSLTQPADGTVVLAGSGLPVTANATSADGGIDRVEFYAGDLLFAQLFAPPYAMTLSSAVAATYALTAVAVDTLGSASTSAVVRAGFTTGSNAPTTLVPTGSTWKYLDDGSNQGTNWVAPGFDDSTWKSGKAELGYGDAAKGRPEATEISYGPDASKKWVTYYFRQAFTVAQAASLQGLSLSLLRDDGAIVYLNGKEVFRSNMPDRPIDYLQLALNAVAGAEETTYFQKAVDSSLMRDGTNVLAVEVHQASRDSPDVSFDLSFAGTRTLLAPAILGQPASQKIQAGGTAVFSVDAGGTSPLSYQWRLNDAPIQDATAPMLVVTNANAADVGAYQVLITNAVGWVMSASATLSLTNGPPVPGADGLLVLQGQQASVPDSTLLANDIDPGGQPLVLTAVSASSHFGATVTWSAGQVNYRPAPDFLGSDWFTYTVAASGGLSAEGRVEVLVYSGTLPATNQLSIVPLTTGYRLRYCGAPARLCELQRSADLAHWNTLVETTIPPHGIVEYLESNPPVSGAYYRVRQQ